MFCNKCGNQVNPGDNICSNCGSPLENSYSNQNYQTQNNYQQSYYTQNNNGYNPLSGIMSNKANIGWLFIIVSLLCSLGNLFMSIATYNIPTGRSSIKFGISFLQLSSLSSFSSGLVEELGGDSFDSGFTVSSVFIWIFTVLSIILVLVSIYMLIKDKTDKSFLLSAISLVSAGIAKLIEIIFILSAISKLKKSIRSYDDDDIYISTVNDIIRVPVFSWIILILIVAAILLIFLYAKKNNIAIIPKRAYNPYQYQNIYQNPYQYQNPDQNYNQYQNNNNYQNNNQNNNQY